MSLGSLAKKCNLELYSGTYPYQKKCIRNFTLATCWLASWLAGWFKKVDNS